VTSALPISEPPPLPAGGLSDAVAGAGWAAGLVATGASLAAGAAGEAGVPGRAGVSAGEGDRTERNFFLKKLNIE
jgi:hypothetical protein